MNDDDDPRLFIYILIVLFALFAVTAFGGYATGILGPKSGMERHD